ncbi:MAG: cation:proton antiporter [Bacteroidales bacterium]|jgi:CPA2 family monovalent cation:H+ antiporter-2|nr:cation:proton antiporter [Bacteroidales bacterium]
MGHLPSLVSDLALILITAGIVTLLFKWLKQPVVLGYIVAGFLVGPHIDLFPSVIDSESISTWSEIGIIFLLFALGLEFRFKKLLEVGRPAIIAAAINMGAMIAVGYLVGRLLGWSSMESIFLGGMFSMASTTIIINAFGDMSLQKERFANIVFGILIIEDIAAILMIVLFSTIAVSQTFEGLQLLESLIKVIFFIIVWFVTGIFLIPTILKKIGKYLSDETLLIISIGLCLGMVLFADAVGLSTALGAFIMGLVLAESTESKRIEQLVNPLKDIFGAVFFVSVGMMIVPGLIVEHIVPILILTSVVLVGRVIFGTLGVLASGESLKVSMQSGFSLAQVGEFSFIIAALGIQLGVLSDFIYPVIVSVSVLTTFTTPYGIRYSGKIYHKIDKLLPAKWNKIRIGYGNMRDNLTDTSSEWMVLLKKTLLPVTVYLTLAMAALILSKMYFIPFITSHILSLWGNILSAAVTISCMSPFLYGLISKRYVLSREQFSVLWNKNTLNKWLMIGINLFRNALFISLIMMVLLPLFPAGKIIMVIVSILIFIYIAINPKYESRTRKIESVFLNNLNRKEPETPEDVHSEK